MVLHVSKTKLNVAPCLAWRMSHGGGYMDVKELEETEVDALLLRFSCLSAEQQVAFLERMNKYLFVSPLQRRKLRLHWEETCLRLARKLQ
jgi:hypothetical protein